MLIAGARKEAVHRVIREPESPANLFAIDQPPKRGSGRRREGDPYSRTRARALFDSQFENRSQGDHVACFPSASLLSFSRRALREEEIKDKRKSRTTTGLSQ